MMQPAGGGGGGLQLGGGGLKLNTGELSLNFVRWNLLLKHYLALKLLHTI